MVVWLKLGCLTDDVAGGRWQIAATGWDSLLVIDIYADYCKVGSASGIIMLSGNGMNNKYHYTLSASKKTIFV